VTDLQAGSLSAVGRAMEHRRSGFQSSGLSSITLPANVYAFNTPGLVTYGEVNAVKSRLISDS